MVLKRKIILNTTRITSNGLLPFCIQCKVYHSIPVCLTGATAIIVKEGMIIMPQQYTRMLYRYGCRRERDNVVFYAAAYHQDEILLAGPQGRTTVAHHKLERPSGCRQLLCAGSTKRSHSQQRHACRVPDMPHHHCVVFSARSVFCHIDWRLCSVCRQVTRVYGAQLYTPTQKKTERDGAKTGIYVLYHIHSEKKSNTGTVLCI